MRWQCRTVHFQRNGREVIAMEDIIEVVKLATALLGLTTAVVGLLAKAQDGDRSDKRKSRKR